MDPDQLASQKPIDEDDCFQKNTIYGCFMIGLTLSSPGKNDPKPSSANVFCFFDSR